MIERTCHLCSAKTFVIFEAKPWCREHFLAHVPEPLTEEELTQYLARHNPDGPSARATAGSSSGRRLPH